MDNIFAVSTRGLAQLIERRGRAYAVLELISNAWDEPGVTFVRVVITPAGRGVATLFVEDDAPAGFRRLSDAYTLFAPTEKRSNAEVRGRFNMGDKMVLSLCDEATITSTTGTVCFRKGERTVQGDPKRERGTLFSATIRLRRSDLDQLDSLIDGLIPPPHIATTYNGAVLLVRSPLLTFSASLDTEVEDIEGMRRTKRKCDVEVYRPMPGEVGMVYEMGIPVVETGDAFHYNVGQKVPLNFERDNVTPAYLRALRVAAATALRDHLTEEDATTALGREVLADPRTDEDTVRKLIELRFGDKVVGFDPSDPEANSLAVAQGYTVVHGRNLSASEWQQVRRAQAIKPAGQVTPSSSKVEMHLGDGPGVTTTPAMESVALYTKYIAEKVFGFDVAVRFVSAPTEGFAAAYGGRSLTYNVGRLGRKFFVQAASGDAEREEELDALIIHELAHELEGNHLDDGYHKALCTIGARMKARVSDTPILFTVAEATHA